MTAGAKARAVWEKASGTVGPAIIKNGVPRGAARHHVDMGLQQRITDIITASILGVADMRRGEVVVLDTGGIGLAASSCAEDIMDAMDAYAERQWEAEREMELLRQ